MEQLTYQQYQVRRLIEVTAQWQERLTTHSVMETFGCSRDTASKWINQYLDRHPNNLQYDASLKGYVATTSFQPHYTQGTLEEYSYFQVSDLSENPTDRYRDQFPVQSLQRQPNPQIIRPIIQAINKQQRIDINYASMSNPSEGDRIISPHSLVHDGARWHVRAWCEKNQNYCDFVLTRIKEVYGEEGTASQNKSQDSQWNTWLTISIQPDPRLTDAQMDVIALDYGMEKVKGRYERSYQVRAATLLYTLQQLRLDRARENPQAQQIILTPESQHEIAPYLPK